MIATEVDHYQEQHARSQDSQSDSAPSWLTDLRRRAIEAFARLGIPTRRIEDWRFTNVSSLANRSYELASTTFSSSDRAAELVDRARLSDEYHRLVFVNGHYAAQWSSDHKLPGGLVIDNLANAIRERSADVERQLARHANFDDAAFIALNTAFASDGAFIDVAENVAVESPIHLVFLSTADAATVCYPRNLIRLGKNSRATLIETYLGGEGEAYFTNAVTEVELAESADLDHYKLQHEQIGALHIAMTQLDQKADSRFREHYFSFGAALSRNEMSCLLDGERIETTLNGLYMPTGDQVMDCRTRIDHAKPNCNSYEMYKGILDDRAKGIFNGKIFVHQDAQKTDAKQSNQALLLSDDAVVNTKPQLEIYADDVRCTHGATIGELDETALYYLRSRGIPAGLARKMLIFAFANDIVQGVDVSEVRQHLESILLSSHGLPDV